MFFFSCFFFFSSRRRHTRWTGDWSSDVCSSDLMLIGVAINYVVPNRAFIYITSTATAGAMWTWGVIVISHLVYRRRVAEGAVAASPFRMPGSPITNWVVVAFLAFVAVLLAIYPSQRVALYAGAVWAVLILVAYAINVRRSTHAG